MTRAEALVICVFPCGTEFSEDWERDRYGPRHRETRSRRRSRHTRSVRHVEPVSGVASLLERKGSLHSRASLSWREVTHAPLMAASYRHTVVYPFVILVGSVAVGFLGRWTGMEVRRDGGSGGSCAGRVRAGIGVIHRRAERVDLGLG